MTIKKENKKYHFIIGLFIILIGILIPIIRYAYLNNLTNLEEKYAEEFIDNTSIISDEIIEEETENNSSATSYNYIAVLEIPSISLKRGLVDINDSANTISKNVQILNESDMPNVANGNLILASHSGTSRISFFQNLYKLENNDLIYIYYNGIKYIYQIVDKYLEIKDGDIIIHRNNEKTTLTLTTCSQQKKGYQLVIISELIDKSNY